MMIQKIPEPQSFKASTVRILVVEDDPDVAEGMADILALEGAVVRVACDGPAALQHALEVLPDVILCDLGLPGAMDGCAVARACRREPGLRHVRLVALSGYSTEDRILDAMSAGFDFYLVKPLTEGAMRTLVPAIARYRNSPAA